MKMNEKMTAELTSATQAMIDKYVADLRAKLEAKLNFINSAAPILEKYQKSNECFTVWRLGVELYGDAYKADRTGDHSKAQRAREYTAKVSNFLRDLVERNVLEYVMDYCNESCPAVYRFKK